MDGPCSSNGIASVIANLQNSDVINTVISLRQSMESCGFCGIKGQLEICKLCGISAYCSAEHKQFDWKRHKPMCITVQNKVSQNETNMANAAEISPSGSSSEMSAFEDGQLSAFKKYEKVSTADAAKNTVPAASPVCAMDCKYTPCTCRLIDTDDPDIQIIESTSTNVNKSRKRPLRTLKDHSLNKAYRTSMEEHRHMLNQQGVSCNVQQSFQLRFAYMGEHIRKSLTDYGWAVVDNFLGNDHCRCVNREMKELEKRGLFSAGQLVKAKDKDEQHVKDIRSDKTFWFSGNDPSASDACTIRMLVTYIDTAVSWLARRMPEHPIQGRSKAMLAIYPGGGSRYVKHVDNPAKDGRRITVIYYCNPGWNSHDDGGLLRIYPETSATPMDIEPRADRLILFWSDHRIPHEVLPVHKDRYAITVWYMDKSERAQHIQKADKPSPSPSASLNGDEGTKRRREDVELHDRSPEGSPKKVEAPQAATTASAKIQEPDDIDSARGTLTMSDTKAQSILTYRTTNTELNLRNEWSEGDDEGVPADNEDDKPGEVKPDGPTPEYQI